MRNPSISKYDLAIIEEHIGLFLAGSERRLEQLKKLPLHLRLPQYGREVQYWKDYKACCKQLLGVAKQRAGVIRNVNR